MFSDHRTLRQLPVTDGAFNLTRARLFCSDIRLAGLSRSSYYLKVSSYFIPSNETFRFLSNPFCRCHRERKSNAPGSCAWNYFMGIDIWLRRSDGMQSRMYTHRHLFLNREYILHILTKCSAFLIKPRWTFSHSLPPWEKGIVSWVVSQPHPPEVKIRKKWPGRPSWKVGGKRQRNIDYWHGVVLA